MKQPRAGVPFKRAGHYYFVSRNNGTQNQHVTYIAWSLEESLAGGRVLVDPNTFSADGTSSLTSLTVSGDGQLVAYGVSEAGSDWTTFRLLNLGSADQVEDALPESSAKVFEYRGSDPVPVTIGYPTWEQSAMASTVTRAARS